MKYTFICREMQSAVALSGALTLLLIGKVCTQFMTKSIRVCLYRRKIKTKIMLITRYVVEFEMGANLTWWYSWLHEKTAMCRWKNDELHYYSIKKLCIVVAPTRKEKNTTSHHRCYCSFSYVDLHLAVANCYINNFMASWASRARIYIVFALVVAFSFILNVLGIIYRSHLLSTGPGPATPYSTWWSFMRLKIY